MRGQVACRRGGDLVAQTDLAGRDALEPGDRAQQCGLAASRRAHDRESLPVGDGQVHAGEYEIPTEAHTGSRDRQRGHRSLRRRASARRRATLGTDSTMSMIAYGAPATKSAFEVSDQNWVARARSAGCQQEGRRQLVRAAEAHEGQRRTERRCHQRRRHLDRRREPRPAEGLRCFLEARGTCAKPLRRLTSARGRNTMT
jgi:hypothetical protein